MRHLSNLAIVAYSPKGIRKPILPVPSASFLPISLPLPFCSSLQVLLRVKENELLYLKQEIRCLRDELQMMQKVDSWEQVRFARQQGKDRAPPLLKSCRQGQS